MNIDIHSNLFQLKHGIEALKKEADKSNSEELSKVLGSIWENISQIRKSNILSSIPLGQRIALANSLGDLKLELDNIQDQGKTQKLRRQILSVQNLMAKMSTNPASPEKKVSQSEGCIGFVCDLDAPDHNGAMIANLQIFIDQNIPCITTRSILCGKALENKNDLIALYLNIQRKLLAGWHIYQPMDSKGINEFLVLLPPTFLPNKNEKERLMALDLKAEGVLTRISLSEALEPSLKEASLDILLNLFSNKPTVNKHFYLAGHGGEKVLGGLTSENYKILFKFLKGQLCKSLTINSCRSGGASSLITSSQLQNESPGFEIAEEAIVGSSFPTIVRSIGDFPTSQDDAVKERKLYFDEVAAFLESSKAKTIVEFRKVIEKVEGNLSKKPTNRIKVFFPHAADAPGGFRSIGERGLGYPLTYAKIKGQELVSKEALEVRDHQYLDVQPLVVDCPIAFKTQDSILLSMVPGKGQHFFKSIQLCSQTNEEFIGHTVEFHSKASLQVSKAFFIGSLKSQNHEWKEIVLLMSPKGKYCSYFEEGDYYFINFNNMEVMKISSNQHALMFREAEIETKPSEEAIRVSSGGQESRKDISEAIRSRSFWHSEPDKVRKLILDLGYWLSKPRNKFLDFINRSELTVEELAILCFFLCYAGKGNWALQIIKQNKIGPDFRFYDGRTILNVAIITQQINLAVYLITHDADANAQDEFGHTPLHLAAATGRAKLVALLLKQPDIEVEIESNAGLTPLYCSLPNHPQIFQLLKSKGASVNHVNKDGESLLGMSIKHRDNVTMDFLLTEQADPNTGSPFPLIEAILNGGLPVVQKLLDRGGDPFKPDAKGRIPLIEAILRGSSEIVNLFLSHPDFREDIQDGKGMIPLAAAFVSGNEKIVQMLIEKNVSFPEKLPEHSITMLTLFIDLVATQKEQLMDKFLGLLSPTSHQHKLLKLFYTRKLIIGEELDLLKKRIANGQISPTLVFGILNSIMAQDKPICTEIVKLCVENGFPAEIALSTSLKKGWQNTCKWIMHNAKVDLNKLPIQHEFPLYALIISTQDKDLVSYAIEHGLNINNPGSSKFLSPLTAVLTLGNLELLDLFLKKGLNPNFLDVKTGLPPLITAAAMPDLDPEKKIFQTLLEAGADINQPDKHGKLVPIFLFIQRGDKEGMELCFDHGAALKTPEYQERAMSFAIQSGNDELVDLLTSKGCVLTDNQKRMISNKAISSADVGEKNVLDDLVEKLKKLLS